MFSIDKNIIGMHHAFQKQLLWIWDWGAVQPETIWGHKILLTFVSATPPPPPMPPHPKRGSSWNNREGRPRVKANQSMPRGNNIWYFKKVAALWKRETLVASGTKNKQLVHWHSRESRLAAASMVDIWEIPVSWGSIFLQSLTPQYQSGDPSPQT